MTTHLSIRLAWHDSGWDGHVCRDPSANFYCVGSHSLLSERLARDRDLNQEPTTPQGQPRPALDAKYPRYLPPCYWSANLRGDLELRLQHRQPFSNYQDKVLADRAPPGTVYTWPFRIAFNHAKAVKNRDGKYPRKLPSLLDRFIKRFDQQSLVFFYLNFDNPISADSYRYCIVGCSRLRSITPTGTFAFTTEELNKLRSGNGMQNYDPLNWAVKVEHEPLVFLPYHAYLDKIGGKDERERELQEIAALVEEPNLIPAFKYVAEEVREDDALLVLYKMRRSLRAADRHGIVDVSQSLESLDALLNERWQARGLYPGLPAIASLLADHATGAVRDDDQDGRLVVDWLRAKGGSKSELDRFFDLLASASIPKKFPQTAEAALKRMRRGFKSVSTEADGLRRLSLLNLSKRQLRRTLFDEDGPALKDIATNPYVLVEEPVLYDRTPEELDRLERDDGEIGYFNVDAGLFPDNAFLEPDENSHTLAPAGPERLRAFALMALEQAEERGHSYLPHDQLFEAATSYPLFHQDKLEVIKGQLLSPGHLTHFSDRMHIADENQQHFFYRLGTKYAEDVIGRVVVKLRNAKPVTADLSWIDAHVRAEAATLKSTISTFDPAAFVEERAALNRALMTRRVVLVSGLPGSGKTRGLREALNRLVQAGKSVVVLAPTGKAALRASEALNDEGKKDIVAQTIDRWLSKGQLADYLDDMGSLSGMKHSERFVVPDVLVIDEMSMVDLQKLATICRALEVHGLDRLKHFILVGDQYQLPPIGCGRPFYDIVQYLTLNADGGSERGPIWLTVNCRQASDPTVLEAAGLFAEKDRYHDDLFARIERGGQISRNLRVEHWSNFAELASAFAASLDKLLADRRHGSNGETREVQLNRLFGLYDGGYVKGNDTSTLEIQAWQTITPYRPGVGGALSLNRVIRDAYRADTIAKARGRRSGGDAFFHSDKIIRLRNHYAYLRETGQKELVLSNGSIGIVCDNKEGRRGYFIERDGGMNWDWFDKDDFELAYAITVHKSQGSEFETVFVVLPARRALMSRELVYTALTRSQGELVLFIERNPADRASTLSYARQVSDLLPRNSSILTSPFDGRLLIEPEAGVRVKSKIEFLIYRSLMAAREKGELTFTYEAPLELKANGRAVPIKPDFTITVGDATVYWEHLGMLDVTTYRKDWIIRRKLYQDAGLEQELVTTDDRTGVRQERIDVVIQDILNGSLAGAPRASLHHYSLASQT